MESISLLLELPPELRNHIYEFVALLDQPYRLKARSRPRQSRFIRSDSGLIATSRRVADEYYDVLAKLALSKEIVAAVTDLNFRPLICFMRAEVLPAKASAAECEKQRLIVVLSVSAMWNVHPDHLPEWPKFCEANGVAARYAISNGTSGPYVPSRGELGVIEDMAEDYGEARKIHDALLDWRSYGQYHAHGDRKLVDAVLIPRG